MAEEEAKHEPEISKEVLAPPSEIREDLVNTAIKFLQNEKVQKSPMSQKKAFLQRKGLTQEEITLAVSRSGITQDAPAASAAGNQSMVIAVPGTSPPALPEKPLELSHWAKAREVFVVIAMVTGVSYAAHRLYKDLLRPWLFGDITAEKRMDILEQLIAESSEKLRSIQTSLDEQQEKLQVLSHDVNSKTGNGSSLQTSSGLTEIKTELSSIKGLLLNRRNFPSLPTSTPALPAWQLASNSGDASRSAEADANSNDKGDNDYDGSPPKITLSSSPASESSVELDITAFEGNFPGSVTINSKSGEDSDAKNSQVDVESESETDLLAKNSNGDVEMETSKSDIGKDIGATGENITENGTEESDQSLD